LCASVAPAETVAYWRFEEGTADTAASGAGSILDSSGHSLNGTPQQSPVYRASVGANAVPATGAGNHLSLDFTDASQLVSVPDDPAFELSHSLTVEAYINLRSPSGGSSMIVFRGDDRAALDPFYLSILAGNLNFIIEDQTNGFAQLIVPYTLDNQWVHVAGTLDDATGAMRLYVNGQQVAATTTSVRPLGPLDPSQNPGIGIGNLQSLATYGPQAFNGLIDEVRISDTALAPSQFLNAVPEPSTFFLAGLGLIGLRFAARRKEFCQPGNSSAV
jgi:hypothetical protein